jgi:hypothetical protein
MEVEFAIQDAFGFVNSELKLASSLQEAGDALSEAVKLNYQVNNSDKTADLDEVEDDHVSDDGADDDHDDIDDNADEDGKSSPEESEVPHFERPRIHGEIVLTGYRRIPMRMNLKVLRKKTRMNSSANRRSVILKSMLNLTENWRS